MSDLNRKHERKFLRIFTPDSEINITQECNKPASIICKGKVFHSCCLRCSHPNCIKYRLEEIDDNSFPDFSFDRNLDVCPVQAIRWNDKNEFPEIDSERCIKCGLCAQRCPTGAIYLKNGKLDIEKQSNLLCKDVEYNDKNITEQNNQINALMQKGLTHQFCDNFETNLNDVYSRINSDFSAQNLLVRNIFLGLNYYCLTTRQGNVHSRVDAVFSNKDKTIPCKGVIEIEFGNDSLEAVRSLLDDAALFNSSNILKIENDILLVVCLSLPKNRQGYYQVVKDIKNVLDLDIQTISLGALLILFWGSTKVRFDKKEFCLNSDHNSLRDSIGSYFNNTLHFKKGYLGVLEPEK